MKARFIRLWAAPILLLCIFAAGTATTAQAKSIDPALLAKANAGDAEAQYQLGNMYNFGDGVRPDYAQALIWYRKSAEQGNADSEFQLREDYSLSVTVSHRTMLRALLGS